MWRSVFFKFFIYLYRFLISTWRIEHVNHPKIKGPIVYGHWHGDELLLIGAYLNSQMIVMASLSRDGGLQTQLLTQFGYQVTRGSSSKGGAIGFKSMLEKIKSSRSSASLAVDGPRGPRFRMKPGLLHLAQKSGCPIVLGAAASRRAFVFKKAWNQCFLPLPFSRGCIVYDGPYFVAADLAGEQMEILRQSLENKLTLLKQKAEQHLRSDLHK